MDTLTPAERSRLMSRIRGKDTKPELAVRRYLHGLGYRYRLHARELPGRPDIVFRPRRKVVFVHGCFWHQHGRCRAGRMPKSNTDYWTEKFSANKRRDRLAKLRLTRLGYRYLVVWECQIARRFDAVAEKLVEFLDDEG